MSSSIAPIVICSIFVACFVIGVTVHTSRAHTAQLVAEASETPPKIWEVAARKRRNVWRNWKNILPLSVRAVSFTETDMAHLSTPSIRELLTRPFISSGRRKQSYRTLPDKVNEKNYPFTEVAVVILLPAPRNSSALEVPFAVGVSRVPFKRA